jgi:glutaredoxin
MKKYVLFLMFITIIAIVILFAIILQKTPEVMLVDGSIVPEPTCSKIDRVIAIGRTGCPHCAIAESRLKELEQEFDMEFKYYNLAISEDAQEVKEFGLIVQFVPSIIINCKVYIGKIIK